MEMLFDAFPIRIDLLVPGVVIDPTDVLSRMWHLEAVGPSLRDAIAKEKLYWRH